MMRFALRLSTAALVLSAVASVRAQVPPSVTWEFVGVDSAKVEALALPLPSDGPSLGLPHPAFATFNFPNVPDYYDFEDGLYRLDDPSGGTVPPEPDPAWPLAIGTYDPYSLYADASGLVLGAAGFPGRLARSTDGGETWIVFETSGCAGDSADPRIIRTYGPGRERTLWLVGNLCRSDDEGATWTPVPQLSAPEYVRRRDLVELPPSAMLPEGRLVMGVGNGILLSEDNGSTWTASSLYAGFRWVGDDLALIPHAAHPYGGTLYALVYDFYFESQTYNSLFVSDDGGQTWALRHRFSYGEHGLDRIDGNPELVALGDGSLVTGLLLNVGGPRGIDLGVVVWSGDGGETWHPLGEQPPWLGEKVPPGACTPACENGMWPGLGARLLRVDREGRIWAGTENGVWRTTGPAWAVAWEGGPEASASVAVSVWPNPLGGRVTVGLGLASPGVVRVSVLDALGREVAVIHDGPASDGQRVAFDTASWPVGSYTVRVETEAGQASAGLTVVR